MEKLDAAVAVVGPEQARRDEVGDAKADGAADERAEHAGDRHLPQAAFEDDDERRKRETETDVDRQPDRKRLENRRGVGDHGDEHYPTERKPGHWGNPAL